MYVCVRIVIAGHIIDVLLSLALYDRADCVLCKEITCHTIFRLCSVIVFDSYHVSVSNGVRNYCFYIIVIIHVVRSW